MSLIIPTITLEKLKKFPTQFIIAVLCIMLGYFINNGNSAKQEQIDGWRDRALISERKQDSLNRAISDFKDALLQQRGELENYKKGVLKIDSATKQVSYPAKTIVKRLK